MQSLGQAMKEFDMDQLTQRIEKIKNSPKHGLDDGITSPIYSCQLCKDEGGEIITRPVTQTIDGESQEVLREYWKVCSCIETKKLEQMFKSSKITREFQKKTFDNFKLDHVSQAVHDAYKKSRVYHDHFEKIKDTSENWICLMGQPGSGKTHLLMSISNGLIAKGIQTLYFSYVEGFEEIKNDIKKEDVNLARFNKMKSVPVLFIDDLFKPPSNPTDYEIRKVYDVLNHRYLNCLPTMISTERTINEMLIFDEALASRINEKCKDFKVVMKGSNLNYRLREDVRA